MSIVVDLAAYRRSLPASVQSHTRTIAQMSMDERMFDASRLPFISSWPIWEGGRDLP